MAANGNNQQQLDGHTFTYDPRYPIPKPSDQPSSDQADSSVTSNVPLIDTQLTSTGGVQSQLPDTSGRFAPIERAAGKAGVPQAGPHPEGTIVITPLPGQDGQQTQPEQPAQPQGWQPSPAATAVAQQQAEQYKAEGQKGPQVWTSTPQLPPEGQTLEQQPHPLDQIQAQNTADNNQVAQAVDEYKTMTAVQKGYAAGQLNKSVALAAQNQIQQTYNNAIPAQQRAMEKAEEDEAKPDVPPPQQAQP